MSSDGWRLSGVTRVLILKRGHKPGRSSHFPSTSIIGRKRKTAAFTVHPMDTVPLHEAQELSRDDYVELTTGQNPDMSFRGTPDLHDH